MEREASTQSFSPAAARNAVLKSRLKAQCSLNLSLSQDSLFLLGMLRVGLPADGGPTKVSACWR